MRSKRTQGEISMSNFRGPGINPFAGTPRGAGWNAKALEIAAARNELNKYAEIMTPYEYQVISNSIKEKIESSYQMVYEGAKNHLAEWVGYYKDAIARYERAQQNETNSWDSGKLLTETSAFQARLERELGNKDGLPLYEGARRNRARQAAIPRGAVKRRQIQNACGG